MLILTRRVGETVMIGDEVTVTVLRVKGNQVRLGVNAPKTISVQREEIFHRIKRESAEPQTNWPTGRAGLRRPCNGPRFAGPDPVAYDGARTGEMAEWSKAHPC